MKKQMKFEKIICYVMLALTAVCFVASLGITTNIYKVYTASAYIRSLPGKELLNDIQPFNKKLVINCIILFLSTVFLFITCTHNRRKYYITNYIAIIINFGLNIGFSIWAISNILIYKNNFLTEVDFELWTRKCQEYSEYYQIVIPYTDSTFFYDACKVSFIILMIGSAFLVLNMIWKIMLMKYEKKILSKEAVYED